METVDTNFHTELACLDMEEQIKQMRNAGTDMEQQTKKMRKSGTE